MGNCIQNTIIEKTNIDDNYNINRKLIFGWPELQYRTVFEVVEILSTKGYQMLITDNVHYKSRSLKYNRIIIIHSNYIVQNIPIVG